MISLWLPGMPLLFCLLFFVTIASNNIKRDFLKMKVRRWSQSVQVFIFTVWQALLSLSIQWYFIINRIYDGTHESGNKSVVIVNSRAVFNSSMVQSVSLTFHHSFRDGPIISHWYARPYISSLFFRSFIQWIKWVQVPLCVGVYCHLRLRFISGEVEKIKKKEKKRSEI